MFSNSKKSEIVLRGGVSIFQISLKFKKVWNIRQGGGSSLFGKKSAIFPFSNYDASPYKVVNYFVEFLGFMVVKTTDSVSGLTSILRFLKRCTVARNICKTNKKKLIENIFDIFNSLLWENLTQSQQYEMFKSIDFFLICWYLDITVVQKSSEK